MTDTVVPPRPTRSHRARKTALKPPAAAAPDVAATPVATLAATPEIRCSFEPAEILRRPALRADSAPGALDIGYRTVLACALHREKTEERR